MAILLEKALVSARLKVIDPGSRLPKGITLPEDATGYLYLPKKGAPIHPDSLARLVTFGMKTGEPTAFVPKIPVTSDLGMPQYSKLAYWLPEASSLSIRQLWRGLKSGIPLKEIEIRQIISQTEIVDFTETPLAEQEFYFIEQYHEICPKPLQVSVVVTNKCNLKCVMCPYHSPVIRPSHATDFFDNDLWMSWEDMQRIAEECGQAGIPVKIGNIEEPLLHPKIVEFVALCREKGVPTVHITSNGLILSEEMARKLLDAGLTSIFISIDGARPETYKRVRGASLEKVENNLKTILRLREEMNKPLTVMTSFIRNEGVTLEEEAEFREKWVHLVDGVIIYQLADYVKGNARIAQLNEVTKSFMEKAGDRRWACMNPWQEMYILPDNRVYYCCESVSKLAHDNLASMGDYSQENILSIWKGPLFQNLRRDLLHNNLDEHPDCKDCGIWMAHITDTEEQEDRTVVSSMMTEIFYGKKS